MLLLWKYNTWFSKWMGCPINIKLICEIFASRSIMGVVTPAISSMIRDRTRSIYRKGAKGRLLKPDQAKRMTDRMINRIDSKKTVSYTHLTLPTNREV